MSALEKNKKRDYSRYDQMSTAELEQLLRLDFQASEEEDSDLDAILYISDLLEKRHGPSDPDAAWAQFQTQYRPYADGRSLYDWEDGEPPSPSEPEQPPPAVRPRRLRHLRRLTVLAAVLAACLLAGMVAAQAAGLDVFGALARWTDETFFFVSPESSNLSGSLLEGEELDHLQSSHQPLEKTDRFPVWYPDRFVPGELEITEMHSSVSAHMIFYEEDSIYTVVIQHYTIPTDNTGTFEKDATPVEEYLHDGQTFYILSNIDTLTAAAYDGEFMTMIFGALTREEIKAIIDSIPGPQSAP